MTEHKSSGEGDENSGNCNSGNCNSGDWNSGYRNSGHGNSGNQNSGYRNSGHGNSGNWNSGNQNSGDWNSGCENSGDWNTGNGNTGNWNSGDRHVGCFNTIDAETAYYFNKPAKVSEWNAVRKPNWLLSPEPTTWVGAADMTIKEKADYPEHETMGGYLRINDMKEEWRKAYEGASEEDREAVKKLPNFDPEVFFEITGLDLREPKQTIVHNGRTYRLVKE